LDTNKKKDNKKAFCEEFFFNGYKIMVGRNSNENIKILKSSKKDDIWLHIKDTPSSHVVIVSKKQQLPLEVIHKAASLCVDVSVSFDGKYIVDYTYRRYVKMTNGSNVLYTNHKSIVVQKGKE
jgi:predicted ribosome quality control (RQC) complex YloA/Tae2 family protein